MGIINSTLGPIKKRIGNMRFAVSRGQNVVASMPSQYNDKKTATQVSNRSKLSLLSKMLGAFSVVLALGNQPVQAGHTSFNVAFKRCYAQIAGTLQFVKAQVKLMVILKGNLSCETPDNETFNATTGTIDWFY